MFERIKKYILTSIELQKLTAIEKIALMIGTFATVSILFIFCLVALLFLSMGLCLYISDLFGNNYAGFLIVGSIYVLLSIIIYFVKEKIITKPVTDSVIKMVFKKIK